MSRLIDLTQTLHEGMPVFPGDPPPRFARVDYGLSCVTELSMTTHTGTHIDCSAHLQAEGTVDSLPLSFFTGRGAAVDCSACTGEIAPKVFEGHDLTQVEFLLLYCGVPKEGSCPVLSMAAMEYLTALPDLRGIGVEALSIDPVDSVDLPLHRLWLCGEKQRCIIENLTGIGQLLGKRFAFMALPLKIKNGEASPVRAIAILEE